MSRLHTSRSGSGAAMYGMRALCRALTVASLALGAGVTEAQNHSGGRQQNTAPTHATQNAPQQQSFRGGAQAYRNGQYAAGLQGQAGQQRPGQQGSVQQNQVQQNQVQQNQVQQNGVQSRAGQQAPLRQNPVQRFWQGQPQNAGASATRGEHLQQWMQQHNQLNTEQQQRALQREPGFQQLPRETQQRMVNRLGRLNALPPQQRERVLQRSEAMERLTPDQRGQVRSAMGQLGSLPQDRRRMVAKSFRDLRNLPPQQRNQILNSPEYRQQYSDEERGTLGNLLSVSPMLPQQ